MIIPRHESIQSKCPNTCYAAKRPPPQKKGWFSGWFRGRKEEDSKKPIRANLGEENSFYYDPELKKWVNKKDPDSATASARSTPPPPKGPAPRSVSQRSAPPPSSPSSRPSTAGSAPPPPRTGSPSVSGPPPAGGPGISRPASTSATGGTPGPAPGSAPPSRPPTSLSNASSIDDLLGAPQARKGGSARSKRRDRGYVDVMTK